jgi:hypothetical protein
VGVVPARVYRERVHGSGCGRQCRLRGNRHAGEGGIEGRARPGRRGGAHRPDPRPGHGVGVSRVGQSRDARAQRSGVHGDPVVHAGDARSGTPGIVVSRGAQVLRGASDADALRALVGGPAVAAFRERIGNFERRLNAGAAARFDDPHAYGFLLAGAFVASLAGDPAAFGRARDVMVGRIRGRVQNVRFDFRDCVTEYERYLLKIDDQRTMCLEAANGRDSWYARAADRLGCEAEYMAQILAGEGQFISCTALGVFAS